MNKNLVTLFTTIMLFVIIGKPIYDLSLQCKLTATELLQEYEEEGEDDSKKEKEEKEEKTEKKETEECLSFPEDLFLNLNLLSNHTAEAAKIATHFADNLTNIILELDTPPPKFLS